MSPISAVLLVGEVIVDFTIPTPPSDVKVRLGGIVHAARGLWAAERPYSIAAFCPKYLVEETEQYLASHGCEEFIWLGDIVGGPNVIAIRDVKETSHQGYEDLLREQKKTELFSPMPDLHAYERVMIFPGTFELPVLADCFSPNANFVFDIAYDIDELSQLQPYVGRIRCICTSTSSELFLSHYEKDSNTFITAIRNLDAEAFLLKENRGGSRLFDLLTPEGLIEEIPASLGTTVNSVGVGDVYSAVMLAFSDKGWAEAAWRGCQVATEYAKTTHPDDLKCQVQRSLQLTILELRNLGGTILNWHERQNYNIYLAGPDFSYIDKTELDHAIECLQYHNFNLRRPIQENGELKLPAKEIELRNTYQRDYNLLQECDAVFAIPLNRDPGTLVEIGMAIAKGIPVITYDPREENKNTMVIIGSSTYSANMDECLNGIYESLSNLRAGNNNK